MNIVPNCSFHENTNKIVSKAKESRNLQRCFRDAALANLVRLVPPAWIHFGWQINLRRHCVPTASDRVCVCFVWWRVFSQRTHIKVRLRQQRVDLLHFAADRISSGGEKRVSIALLCALLLHNYSACVRCEFYITPLLLFSCIALITRILINMPLVFSPLCQGKKTHASRTSECFAIFSLWATIFRSTPTPVHGV